MKSLSQRFENESANINKMYLINGFDRAPPGFGSDPPTESGQAQGSLHFSGIRASRIRFRPANRVEPKKGCYSLNEGEMQLNMASSASISVIVVGDLSLSFSNNSILVLHDCLFVLDSRKNLISISKLCNDNYSVSFNKTYVSIMKENEVVTYGTLVNNLYHIDCVVIQIDNVEKSLKRKEPSINQTQLWN